MWDWNLWQCVSSQRDSVNQDGVKMDSCWLLLLAFFFFLQSQTSGVMMMISEHTEGCVHLL